jgi:hypothetical protein
MWWFGELDCGYVLSDRIKLEFGILRLLLTGNWMGNLEVGVLSSI